MMLIYPVSFLWDIVVDIVLHFQVFNVETSVIIANWLIQGLGKPLV